MDTMGATISPTAKSMLCPVPAGLKLISTKEEFAAIPTIASDSWEYLRTAPQPAGFTRLILIRHGESESNRNGSIAGRTLDSPLTELGRFQAQEAGEWLARSAIPIGAVYSSPMTRAINTAGCVFPAAAIAIDERLHEKFYGPMEGQGGEMYRRYIQKEQDELAQLSSFEEKYAYKPHPEFESGAEVYERVRPFIIEAHRKHPGQNVLAATHGGLMKAIFLLDAAKRGFETDYRSIFLANAGVLVVEVEDEEITVMATTRITYK